MKGRNGSSDKNYFKLVLERQAGAEKIQISLIIISHVSCGDVDVSQTTINNEW